MAHTVGMTETLFTTRTKISYIFNVLTPVQKLISDADAILSGKHVDPLLDWRDAAQMYKAAGEFGSGDGFAKLAFMYRSINTKQKYFKKDLNKALELYKKSVNLGHFNCIPQLSGLYLQLGEAENAIKVWKIYFDNIDDMQYKMPILGYYVRVCIENNKTHLIDTRINSLGEEVLKILTDDVQVGERTLKLIHKHMVENNFPVDVIFFAEAIETVTIKSDFQARVMFQRVEKDTDKSIKICEEFRKFLDGISR